MKDDARTVDRDHVHLVEILIEVASMVVDTIHTADEIVLLMIEIGVGTIGIDRRIAEIMIDTILRDEVLETVMEHVEPRTIEHQQDLRQPTTFIPHDWATFPSLSTSSLVSLLHPTPPLPHPPTIVQLVSLKWQPTLNPTPLHA